MPAFKRLRQQGKTRFLGVTAIGDTTALRRVIDAGAFDIRSLATVTDYESPIQSFYARAEAHPPALRSGDDRVMA